MLRARFELHHSQPKLKPKCDIMSIRPRTICLCLGIHPEASPKLSRKHPTPLANGPWLENVEDLSHVIPMDLSSFSIFQCCPYEATQALDYSLQCYRVLQVDLGQIGVIEIAAARASDRGAEPIHIMENIWSKFQRLDISSPSGLQSARCSCPGIGIGRSTSHQTNPQRLRLCK